MSDVLKRILARKAEEVQARSTGNAQAARASCR